MNEKDELSVQKALYGVILERGNQCLSQTSMRTGVGVKADRRKFKSSWLKEPQIADMEKGKRKCDYLLVEILNDLWKT